MFPRTFVIVLFLAAQTALLWFVAARDRTPQVHFAWTTNTIPLPAPVVAPAPAPVPVAPPATTRPTCPPMRTDAAPLPKDHELPRGVNHVTPSQTNAGWLAAWSEEKVYVSFDGGLTFQQVLDGPGNVEDVTFDCFGHPIVSRGSKIGIRDGTRESWREVPGLLAEEYRQPLLIGGGPDVVVAGTGTGDDSYTRVAISADLGTTWWYRDTGVYWDSSRASGHQTADGTIDVVFTVADCMSDPSTWVRVSNDGVLEIEELGDVGRIKLYDDIAIATYPPIAGVDRGDGDIGWKRFGEKAWHEIEGVSGDGLLLADGPLPRASGGARLAMYTIDRKGRAKALRPWPYGSDAAVDRAGRLWGIDETKDGEDAWLVAVPSTKAPIPEPEPLPSNE
jgi:hypothetical protein